MNKTTPKINLAGKTSPLGFKVDARIARDAKDFYIENIKPSGMMISKFWENCLTRGYQEIRKEIEDENHN